LDRETGMEAFQLRLWDGRIGRWLSPDPYGQYASPYLGMGNNPIGMIDPDGGFAGPGDPPGFWARFWTMITGYSESEYQEIPKDIAYSIQIAEVTVTGTNNHHINNGVNSHIVGSVGYSANYGAIGSTTNGGLALPQDFGSWNSAGSDGRIWIGCMACHGDNGAYRTLAYNSPSAILGAGIGSLIPINGLMRLRVSNGVNPSSLIRTEVGRTWTVSTRNVANIMNSAKTKGILEPVDVFVFNGNSYIINGHHRVEAAIRLGQNVPVNYLSSPGTYSNIFELQIAAQRASLSSFKVDGRMLNSLLK
jgi:uncharacterized ParB-like nuclease family protein